MKSERLTLIQEYLTAKNSVSIEELCTHFHVSVNTIRRDLNILKSEGKILKVYGGAKLNPNYENPYTPLKSYRERHFINSTAKKNVARIASTYISDGDCIFIDTGTSTAMLLPQLSKLKYLTIITNNIYILHSCLDYPQFTAIALPGVIKTKTASIVGIECLNSIGKYHIDKAFMACTTISKGGDVGNSSVDEYVIKTSVLEHSKHHYLLTDHTKFSDPSLMTFADIHQFEYVFTDILPSEDYMHLFSDHAVTLISAAK